MAFAFGYAPPLMIEAGVRHGLFDALVQQPLDIDALTSQTGTSRRGMTALANGLVGLGLLQRDAQGCYALTPESSAFLVSAKPEFRGGLFKHASTQLMPKWLQLTEAVKTGLPVQQVNEHDVGAAFFQQFVEDIYPMSAAAAQVLADELDVGRMQGPVPVLDIASGSGVWGIAMARSSPQVQVTAVDWSEVLPVTRRIAAQQGVAPQFNFIAGDSL